MLFVLSRSGCLGHLTSGRIERVGPTGLNVYSEFDGSLNEYISGDNLRSWCVLGGDGKPLPGWFEASLEDYNRIVERFLT